MFGIGCADSQAQPVTGFWLGVTYPSNPNQAIYNYAMTLTQTNGTFNGTSQTSNPTVSLGGAAYVKETVSGTTVILTESAQPGSTAVQSFCFWQDTLTYNPVDESLIGTYSNIVNGTTCTQAGGGKVELYQIVLKSGNTYCKGSPINLAVTGKNIRWYASASGTNLLATGNTYSPKITQTTTFYITQTLYQNESPPIPITVQVTEPVFKTTPINAGCDKSNGQIEVTASAATGWQYSLNGGPFQASPLFINLAPGSYTVAVKDTTGCQAAQPVTITMAQTDPVITTLVSTSPHCETANGQVTIVATGGQAPLIYSINYGVTFQSSPLFTRLAGGTYGIRVHDANGCEVNKVLSLPAFKPMVIQSVAAIPTSCGQANGQATLSTAGGTVPIQYSIDNQSFQVSTIFTGLQAGNHTLLARDSAGCTVSQSVSIATSTGPPLAEVSVTGTECGQKNGAIVITSARAADLAEYSIDGKLFQLSTTFPGLSSGTYMLTTRDDKNCTRMQPIQVASTCANRINLPTAFSPNHDNLNDALTVYFEFSSLAIVRFTVYDRWGTVIYNRANFVLASGDPLWDGQLNGQVAPIGVYIYRLDCQFPDGTQITYRESVALLN